MIELNKWLQKQAAQESRKAILEDALFTDRASRYGSYRLRYILIRAILRAALHMMEVVLFSAYFSKDFLGPVLIIRSITAFGVGSWWGGLEQLRKRIRCFAENREWISAEQTIETWLSMSVLFSALVLFGGATWILKTPDEQLGFSIFDTYALGCLVRFTTDIVAKTYHSGMFAIRRIYRPLFSLIIGDFLDVALVVALFPFIGPWCFGIVIAFTGLLRMAIALHYVQKSFATSKIPALRIRSLKFSWRKLRADDFLGFLKGSLGSAALQFDSILIVALVGARDLAAGHFELAILFYVLRPFIFANFNWARLFYFDLVKITRKYSSFLLKRFEWFLYKTAFAFAGVIAVVSAAWILAFWRGPVSYDIAFFVPFFFVQSVLGLFQIQAFSYGNYKYLAATAAALCLIIASVFALPLNNALLLAGATAVMAAVLLILRTPKHRGVEDNSSSTISIHAWLNRVAQIQGPSRIGKAFIWKSDVSVSRVLDNVAKKLGEKALVTTSGRRCIVWAEEKSKADVALREIALASAGLIDALKTTEWLGSGKEAIHKAGVMGFFTPDVCDALSGKSKEHTSFELVQEFIARFPQGIVLTAKKGSLKCGKIKLKAEEVYQISGDMRVAAGLSSGSKKAKRVDVTAYCPAGSIELAFLVEKDKYKAPERLEWKRLVESASVSGSV